MAAPKLGAERLTPREPAARAKRGEELRRMYEAERMTTIEIASAFGVTHKSVIRALKVFGIKRRPVGHSRHVTCCEDDCDLPAHKVKHATNGSRYGKRCRIHWIIFRMEVNQRYNDKHLGKDDEAWLRRLRQLLARVQRVNREVSASLRTASLPETTSQSACPR